MLTIGCHLSKRRGYLEMAKEAASINANNFQYFTRSPTRWPTPPTMPTRPRTR